MAIILIVEDDSFILSLVEQIVSGWGHKTLSADSVDAALKILQSKDHIDAMVTDIRLNDHAFGGCQLAVDALKLRPDIRVLYTTGYSLTQQLKAQFIEGTDVLLKPYTDTQLRSAVDTLIK